MARTPPSPPPSPSPSPSADAGYPRPVRLPGNMPAGAHLLEGHHCPDCAKPFLYAHCGASACRMLFCPDCKLVHRPMYGTSYRRGTIA